MEPDFYWQVMTCLFISRPRNVLDPPVRITTTSQNKCLYIYLLLFSYPKLNSQCFLWVSQPRVTSSPKPEALAYFFFPALHVIHPPGYFTHSLGQSESNCLRLFMGQSGQVRGPIIYPEQYSSSPLMKQPMSVCQMLNTDIHSHILQEGTKLGPD